MNNSFGAGGFNATSAGESGSDNKPGGLLPLVIQQVLDSSDSGITMFGNPYTMITLVAIVRNVDYSSTKVTYQLEDHTGRLDAHFWLEEEGAANTPSIVPQSYARVIGSVRYQGGTKTVMIYNIKQINSPNQVTTHFLEVLYARYKSEENSKRKVEPVIDTKANATSHGGFMETGSVGSSLGLNGKQLAVYKVIKCQDSEIGISRKQLEAIFTHINASEMQNITDFMTQEGMIYTTVDEDHFLCVEG